MSFSPLIDSVIDDDRRVSSSSASCCKRTAVQEERGPRKRKKMKEKKEAETTASQEEVVMPFPSNLSLGLLQRQEHPLNSSLNFFQHQDHDPPLDLLARTRTSSSAFTPIFQRRRLHLLSSWDQHQNQHQAASSNCYCREDSSQNILARSRNNNNNNGIQEREGGGRHHLVSCLPPVGSLIPTAMHTSFLNSSNLLPTRDFLAGVPHFTTLLHHFRNHYNNNIRSNTSSRGVSSMN